jgi:hypothetical protein
MRAALHIWHGACAIGIACLLLAGMVSMDGCKIRTERSKPEAPARPAGVPRQAIWSGGVDGGVFLIVLPVGPSEPNVYTSQIYNDYSGEILYQGRLLLEAPNGAPVAVTDPASYSGWDGDTLFLSDGRQLRVPTTP